MLDLSCISRGAQVTTDDYALFLQVCVDRIDDILTRLFTWIPVHSNYQGILLGTYAG